MLQILRRRPVYIAFGYDRADDYEVFLGVYLERGRAQATVVKHFFDHYRHLGCLKMLVHPSRRFYRDGFDTWVRDYYVPNDWRVEEWLPDTQTAQSSSYLNFRRWMRRYAIEHNLDDEGVDQMVDRLQSSAKRGERSTDFDGMMEPDPRDAI